MIGAPAASANTSIPPNAITRPRRSTATWVAFKVWGIIPLIFLFALAQTPFVMKHHIEPGKSPD